MELPDLIQCSGLQHSLARGVHSTTMPWFDSYFNLKHLWCLFQPCLDSHRVTEMSQHLVPPEEPWDEHMQNAPQIYAHRHAWAQPWWPTHRPPQWHPYNIRQGRGLLGHLTPLRKTLSSRKLKDILIHHESLKTCGRADPCWVFTSYPQPPSPPVSPGSPLPSSCCWSFLPLSVPALYTCSKATAHHKHREEAALTPGISPLWFYHPTLESNPCIKGFF